jgi:hypothetical protein
MKNSTANGNGVQLHMTATNDQITLDDEAVQLSRRVFIRSLTAGAAALALNACGGGGSMSIPASASTSNDPVSGSGTLTGSPSGSSTSASWATIPTIAFTQGVAARISIAAYLSGANADSIAITKNSVALPPGVTYDQATKSFVYDGIGAVGLTDGHVLIAATQG